MAGLLIDRVSLYLDTRSVSHQLLLKSRPAGDDVPTAAVLDEICGGSFTCTAVASLRESPSGPLMLLADYFFDGLAELQPAGRRMEPTGPQVRVHTMVVTLAGGGMADVLYYLDGRFVFKQRLAMQGKLASSTLHARATGAMGAMGGLLGKVHAPQRHGGTLEATLFMFALHREALRDVQISEMASCLVGQRQSCGWRWVEPRSRRRLQLARAARLLREAARASRPTLKLGTHRKMRVQPLFLLVPRTAGGRDRDTAEQTNVKYTSAGVEGKMWIWVCLPGRDSSKVVFKFRSGGTDDWPYEHENPRYHGNGWWTSSSQGDGFPYEGNESYEHAVFVDGAIVMDGIETPEEAMLVPTNPNPNPDPDPNPDPNPNPNPNPDPNPNPNPNPNPTQV